MPSLRVALPVFIAIGLLSGCAANGDPGHGSGATGTDPPKSGETSAGGAALAPIESRDVAVLVLEQTPSSLRVTSSARRPRSAFGPAAAWNGTGAATHRWALLGPHGETLASGDIVARGALEAPPDPAQKAPAAHVPLDTFAFTVKVPHPAPGETIEIAPVSGSSLVARWP